MIAGRMIRSESAVGFGGVQWQFGLYDVVLVAGSTGRKPQIHVKSEKHHVG